MRTIIENKGELENEWKGEVMRFPELEGEPREEPSPFWKIMPVREVIFDCYMETADDEFVFS